jgi:hypothetical protein
LDLARFNAVVNRGVHAGDPAGLAAHEQLDDFPVLIQDRDNARRLLAAAPVAQKVRRADDAVRFMVPVGAVSAWTPPNQRPRDGFEFFTCARPNWSK